MQQSELDGEISNFEQEAEWVEKPGLGDADTESAVGAAVVSVTETVIEAAPVEEPPVQRVSF